MAIQYLSGASNWVSVNILIIEGVLLTLVLLVDPEGLAGIALSLLARLRPRPAPPPPPPGSAPAPARLLPAASLSPR